MKPNKDWSKGGFVDQVYAILLEGKFTEAGEKTARRQAIEIGHILNKDRRKVREMVKGMEFSERQRSEKEDGYHFVKGFNQALQDLLTKLGSNTEGV